MEEGSEGGLASAGVVFKLAASTGVLKGLRKDKSAENLLRVLLMHLGCGHSDRRASAAGGAGRAVVGGVVEATEEVAGALCIELFRERGVEMAAGGGFEVRAGDDGEGAGQVRVAVAHSLQRAVAVAGVRLLQAHRDGGARHGGIAAAVPDRRGRLPAGRIRAAGIGYVAQAGGRVTVRVNTGTLGFQTPEGQPFDLLAKVSELKSAGALRSWPVRVAAPQAGLVSGRVCAIRKTQEAIRIAQAGIRKEAARKGRQVQPQTLEFARYVMLFTTFPATEFACAEVLEWYRIRWQVELVFKRFKSLAQLGHLRTTPRAPRPGCTASCSWRCWWRN